MPPVGPLSGPGCRCTYVDMRIRACGGVARPSSEEAGVMTRATQLARETESVRVPSASPASLPWSGSVRQLTNRYAHGEQLAAGDVVIELLADHDYLPRPPDGGTSRAWGRCAPWTSIWRTSRPVGQPHEAHRAPRRPRARPRAGGRWPDADGRGRGVAACEMEIEERDAVGPKLVWDLLSARVGPAPTSSRCSRRRWVRRRSGRFRCRGR